MCVIYGLSGEIGDSVCVGRSIWKQALGCFGSMEPMNSFIIVLIEIIHECIPRSPSLDGVEVTVSAG